VAANDELQRRLEHAELKIRRQFREIRTRQGEACVDALTRLPNRRAFDDRLQEALDAFHLDGKPFSLLMLDVDYFKPFNISHGQAAGDEVLRCLGRKLSKALRRSDLAFRSGGEEFAVILPNTRTAQAHVAVERVRRAVEAMEVAFDGRIQRITASLGIAESCDGDRLAQLLRRARQAVYASKQAGRNCSHEHDGTACEPIGGSARGRRGGMTVDPLEPATADKRTAALV
jgi:diguanylate cyclase